MPRGHRGHRGFASLTEANRREIARRGGLAAHQRGRAHEWTREEAREAGRKGGGVLLRSGEDPRADRVAAVAVMLEDIATTLDEVSKDRGVITKAEIVQSIRESITRAGAAVDRIETRNTM
jgi:general stress protein YciG